MNSDYCYLNEYWGVILSVFVLIIGIVLLFYFSQYKLLNAISPQNRLMAPGNVFLQIIPLFGLVYSFIVTAKIADSIRLEADSRHLIGEDDLLERPLLALDETRPTYNIEITRCILSICSAIPVIGSVAVLAFFVCWIIYWSKIVSMKNLIQAS